MRPVERGEILGLADYEQIRERFRRRIIELKNLRRVAVGPNLTVLFENRDTAMYQVQEMLRTERITKEKAILHEIETYNAFVPKQHELCATAMIEYPDAAERDEMLVRLAGVEKNFYVEVAGAKAYAVSDPRGVAGDRTTAVHYLAFQVGDELTERLRQAASIYVGVDHAAYDHRAKLEGAALASLQEDLAEPDV